MSQPFFSIIIPAYNSSQYIRKGLDSIKEQSFKDYELIIVCDSCTDNTEEIAKEYTDKVFTCNYGSAGGARNVGLDHAKGQWILFMDDDDWWLHEYVFQILSEQCKKTNNDAIAFSFIYKTEGYAKCSQRWIAVWNKAWRRSFLESKPYRFPTTLFWDDVKFSEEVHPKAKFTLWNMPLYYYNFGRKGSVTIRKLEGKFGTRVQDDYNLLYKK